MNEMFTQNIQCLPTHLRAMLPDQPFSNIRVVQGERGYLIAQLIQKDSTIHTNSLVDPWKEAGEWAETLDYKDVFVSFIYGCGFGYPLFEYVKRKKAYTITVIIERDIELFHAMLCTFDLRPILENSMIHFVIGDMEEIKKQIGELFTADFLLYASKPASFFTWLAHRNEKRTYLSIHEWLFNNLELCLSNVGNSIHDSLVGMYNMIDNVKHIFHNPKASSFQHAFKDMPAIIVSNGPSLDQNIEHLQHAIGKAVVLSAESALQPCLTRNIIPDGVCITERTPNTYTRHFKDIEYPPHLAMIGLNLMDPRIPDVFAGPWIPIFRKYESTSQWINEAVSDGCGFNGGSSSAHLAFEFAQWLGCNPIILVGQDLAFGPGNETHSKYSSYYTSEQMAEYVAILQSQPKVMVKGNSGGMIPTLKVWYEFKTWFEQQIEQNAGLLCINATEGGAYIEGTQLMTLKDAIQQYCDKPLPLSLFDFIQHVLPDPKQKDINGKYEALLEKIKTTRELFRSLSATAEQDIQNCQMVIRSCEMQKKYNGPLPSFVRELYHTNFNAFRNYGTKAEVITFTQSIIFSAYKRINDIGEADTEERLLEISLILKEMYEFLKGSCDALEQHFTLAEERLKSQRVAGGGNHDAD